MQKIDRAVLEEKKKKKIHKISFLILKKGHQE